MNPEELSHFIQHEAKIAFDDGIMFGENGATFQKLTFACPRYMVEDCMKRQILLSLSGEKKMEIN